MNQSNNQDTPMVSVCMITYNHEKFIREAIDGVLMQKTTFPIQLLIGEDCSTDNTRAICEEYQQKHPQLIKLLPTEKNLGMMPNFIRTLEACTGKYTALCEGDDYWIDEDKLQIQVEYLENHPEFTLTYSYQYKLKNNTLNPSVFKGERNNQDILNGFIPPTRTMLFVNSPGFISFIRSKKNEISGDKFVAYYQSKIGKLKCIERYTAVYRITNFGIWTSIPSNKQIIIALTYYFNFRKSLSEPTKGLHALIRLQKHTKELAAWFSPRKSYVIYFHSLHSLIKNGFYVQSIILILLFPKLNYNIFKNILSHNLKF